MTATYRCKTAYEAMQWTDTDDNREIFSRWFERHGAMFETRGPIVVLPDGEEVIEGDWVICNGLFGVIADGEFQRLFDKVIE